MKARPGPAYRPEEYTRGYSREQILDHLTETLEIFHELDGKLGVPKEIAPSVFMVAQTMVSAVEQAGAKRHAVEGDAALGILRSVQKGTA